MSNPDPSAVAAQLRAIVQPKKGRLSFLDSLSDAQLIQVAHWIRDGKANELIARTILDLWGLCTEIDSVDLNQSLTDLRKKILDGKERFIDELELIFDPLAENASLIRELQTEWRAWNQKAQESDADKTILEHADRLARLLSETIQNHASIQVKLADAKITKATGSNTGNSRVGIQGNMNVLVQLGSAKGVDDFFDVFKSGLQELATKTTKKIKKLNAKL
jgi:hypothetical protein